MCSIPFPSAARSFLIFPCSVKPQRSVFTYSTHHQFLELAHSVTQGVLSLTNLSSTNQVRIRHNRVNTHLIDIYFESTPDTNNNSKCAHSSSSPLFPSSPLPGPRTSSSAVQPAATQLRVPPATKSAVNSAFPAPIPAVPIWKVDVLPTLFAKRAAMVFMAAARAETPALVMVAPNT